LLVFVDCMMELAAALLLRPLHFETLATHLYAEASRGTYEDGAVAALLIVVFGLEPVILLARMSRGRYAVAPRAPSSGAGRPPRVRTTEARPAVGSDVPARVRPREPTP